MRSKLFWAIALQGAIVNFFLGGFGPGQSLLRAQQHTSLAVAGLHGTALGIATIFAGIANPHLAHRYGRSNASWFGMAIFTFGVFMFVVSPPVQLTLIATLFIGFGTAVTANSMVTQVFEYFKKDPAKVIAQASGIYSGGYILGILTAGTTAGTSFNWRLGFLAVLPMSGILYLSVRRLTRSEHVQDEHGPQRGSLSLKFWISWVGFIASVSTEFATTFWASALLRDRVGGSAAISTICIVAVGSGMGIGRIFGSGLLKNLTLDSQFKSLMAIQFFGFALFWFSHVLWISLTALFAVGFGLSMQFALCSLRLIRFSEERPDLAIARSGLGGGIALAGAPFLLGLIGDHLGVSRAYLMVPVLIMIAMATVIAIPSEQSVS